MFKIILIVLFAFLPFLSEAQTSASVEKSIWQIQTGYLGVYVSNESRISNHWALRKEIGLNFGYADGFFMERPMITWFPNLNLEPRWYYNLNKRVTKGKKISGNSGNFIAIRTAFYPNVFVLSNYPDVSVVPSLSIVPTWGIRRHIGKHFNYEAGFGLGYGVSFGKSVGYLNNDADINFNLQLRMGYTF